MAEIFGALGTAISLLDLARQGFLGLRATYKEFRDAGEAIVNIERQFNNIHYLIKAWYDFWMIMAPTADQELIYTAFWGKAWELIKPQLATMETKCDDLATILNPFLSGGHQLSDSERERARERLARRQGHVNHENSELFLPIRLREEHVASAQTLSNRANFVFKSSDKLRNYLEELQRDYEALGLLVEAGWREKHPTVALSVSTHVQRRLIALEETLGPIVLAAKENRKETMNLHIFCLRTIEALDLGLNLLKTNTATSKIRCFEMIIAHPQGRTHETHLQVCAEVAKPSDDVARTFSDACTSAERTGRCIFRADVEDPAYRRRPAHFSLESLQLLRWGQYSKSNLSCKLYGMPLAQRLDLAYQVVESGLLLLGTPWLSALGSNTICLTTESDKVPRYVLDIIKESSQQSLPEEFRYVNRDIFAVGVLLVELALRRNFSGVEFHASRVCLVEADSIEQQPRWCSLQSAVRQVRMEWSASYAEAVEFCLQDPFRFTPNNKWEEGIMEDTLSNPDEISVALLDPFYKNVFLKIALVHSVPSDIRRSQVAWLHG